MRKIIIYTILLTLIITVISPVSVITSNPDDFKILNYASFFQHMLIAYIFVFFPLLLFFLAIYKLAKNKYHIIVFISSVVILWSLYLPLPVGKLDGVDLLRVSLLNLFMGLIISLIIVYFKKKSLTIIMILISGPVVLSLVNFVYYSSQEHSSNEILPMSDKRNIMVISFDSLQYKYVNEVIESNEKYKHTFNGFTMFSNVNAVAPFTKLSTYTTKLGYLPEINNDKNYSFYSKDFITSRLKSINYRVETYADFNIAESSSTNRIKKFGIKKQTFDKEYINSLFVGILKIFPDNRIVKGLKKIYIKIMPFDYKSNNRLFSLFENDPHPVARNKQDILDYDSFVKSLTTASSEPTFRLHHYVFTHDPIRFDRDCHYQKSFSNRRIDFIPGENECVVNKMIELLEKLKLLGIYDKTLIVFKSDHGYERHYNQSSDIGAIPVSRRWSLSRYTPLLMIKDFDSSGEYKQDKSQVSLIDITKTICLKTLPENGCAKYIGINLLPLTKQDLTKERPVMVSKTDKDKREYNDFNVFYIPRTLTLKDYIKSQ